jgi:hypothetical protein
MNKNDNWHYARPELAKKYIELFSIGLTSARGLFARRRMGKTEFLKQDFIPIAEKNGYKVAYVNLWDLETDPQTAIILELYKITKPKGLSKILSGLKKSVSKVKASGKIPYLIEGAIEAEWINSKNVSGTLLMEIMQQFDESHDTIILIIDEAQVLAYEENSKFAHALRAALDIRKNRIKVIFAGSSENTLRKMFGMPSEPFYNWAPLEPFELLGNEFVKEMVNRINKVSKFPLGFSDALDAFAILKNTPEFFRRYIEYYLINPLDGSSSALQKTQEKVFNNRGFKNQWDLLLPTDQAILILISEGKQDIYGKQNMLLLEERLGINPIFKNTVQNSIRRLSQKNILTRLDYGKYQFEDEAFSDWVKYHDES